MIDPDDVEAIQLERALSELIETSRRLADPEAGLWAFLDLVTAVLMHQQAPGRPLSWTLLTCARRTIVDIRLSM